MQDWSRVLWLGLQWPSLLWRTWWAGQPVHWMVVLSIPLYYKNTDLFTYTHTHPSLYGSRGPLDTAKYLEQPWLALYTYPPELEASLLIPKVTSPIFPAWGGEMWEHGLKHTLSQISNITVLITSTSWTWERCWMSCPFTCFIMSPTWRPELCAELPVEVCMNQN